jgi:RHS repeat-associated protein
VPRAALLALTLATLVALPSRAGGPSPSPSSGRSEATALRPPRPDVAVRDVAHDLLDRLTSIAQTGSDGKLIGSFEYTLGRAGNRIAVRESNGRSVTYAFDRNYRLIHESMLDGPSSVPHDISYGYDCAGNRIARETTSPSGSRESTSYTFDVDDQLLEERVTRGTDVTSRTFTYDDNGSLTSESAPGFALHNTWTPERRLATSSITITGQSPVQLAFEYDDDGTRVARTRNGVRSRYLLDESGDFANILAEYDADTDALIASYVVGLKRISRSAENGTTFYLHDGHGSVRAVLDGAGAIVKKHSYDAFGSSLGVVAPTDGDFGFAGEQFEESLGSYYLRARHYQPGIGRFSTPDFLDRDRNSFHKYIFALNDPVNGHDPSGLVTLIERLNTATIVASLRVISIISARPVLTFVVTTLSLTLLPKDILDGIDAGLPPNPLSNLFKAEVQVAQESRQVTRKAGRAIFEFLRDRIKEVLTPKVRGGQNNANGRTFEDFVNDTLFSFPGVKAVRQAAFNAAGEITYEFREQFGKNVPKGYRFADFLVEFVTKTGDVVKWLVEVKSGSKVLSPSERQQARELAKIATNHGRRLVYVLLEEPEPETRAFIEGLGGRVVSYVEKLVR